VWPNLSSHQHHFEISTLGAFLGNDKFAVENRQLAIPSLVLAFNKIGLSPSGYSLGDRLGVVYGFCSF